MRIVNRTEFLKLPENTVFSKYKPCSFDGLRIKGETNGNDFTYQNIVSAIAESATDQFVDIILKKDNTGENMPMDFNCMGRDGLYEEDQLFAVWDDDDVNGLIGRLVSCTDFMRTASGLITMHMGEFEETT